ncbi:MAG: DUF427 domain-containing protein [Candidatus Krumholzibacteriia bacterium]
MAKAIWRGTVIAESDTIQEVEGNLYFPPDSVKREYLTESDTKSVCPWKGTASYYHIEVGGASNQDAAWYYPDPSEAAMNIKNHLAFWRGVEVYD